MKFVYTIEIINCRPNYINTINVTNIFNRDNHLNRVHSEALSYPSLQIIESNFERSDGFAAI